MTNSFVLTVVGPDRPGLVESIAELVARNGGNWLDSRMAHLGGQFAGILHISLPPSKISGLTEGIEELEIAGLRIIVQADASPSPPAAGSKTLVLDLLGADRPGIVQHVSQILARHGCNVEEFTSEVVSAPMSGEPLFKAEICIQAPSDTSLDAVRVELETIAADLMVEIKTREIGPPV